MKYVHLGAITLSVGVLLSACGGGGGGAMIETPRPPDPAPSLDTQNAFSGSASRDSGAITERQSSLTEVIRGSSGPVFGSVSQNYYTAGLSAARRVNTTFTGDRFTLQVNRQDGSAVNLDSARDTVFDVVTYSPSENTVTDRPSVDGYIAKVSGNTATVAAVGVEWSSTDYTDYLAGGYWIHFDGNSNDLELGAFIDGPAFEDLTHNLPVTGTATYNGRAGGLYLGMSGTDTVSTPGTFEEGQYQGNVRLTADFGTSQISGRIYNVGVYNINGIETNGNTYFDPYLTSTDYEAHLASVSINPNGTFGGAGVRVTHPDLTITSSTGSWGGRFSNVNDSAGNPRAAAGTHAVYFTTAGGSEAILTGAFYGATEQFE